METLIYLRLKSYANPTLAPYSMPRGSELLEKRLRCPSGSQASNKGHLLQALRWPLQKAETEESLRMIERFKSSLTRPFHLIKCRYLLSIF